MSVQSPTHITVLARIDFAYGRDVFRGISRFARSRVDWQLSVRSALHDTDPFEWLKQWRGGGLLIHHASKDWVAAARRRRIPMVSFSHNLLNSSVPVVITEDRTIVRMAMEYFAGRGFDQVAYVGMHAYEHDPRAQAYENYCRKSRMPALRFDGDAKGLWPKQSGSRRNTALSRWLAELPKPIAVLAWNDITAQTLIESCQSTGLSIPDQVSILGIDNDELLCEMSAPTLSSIDVGAEQIGFKAASLLADLLKGKTPLGEPLLTPPMGVVTRQSTDFVAVEDPLVEMALRYIHAHAVDGIQVAEVLDHVPLSRRSLERRFVSTLGRTPLQEIRRVRLERAKRLLVDSDMGLVEVAEAVGMKDVRHLHSLFRQRLETTPSAFRQKHRPG